MEEGEMLTVGKAAEYLGVSRQQIHQLVRTGRLHERRTLKDRRLRLISRAELDALKAEYETG